MKVSVIIILFGVCFWGCLKDDPMNDYSNAEPIVLIPNANRPSISEITPMTVSAAGGIQSLMVYARLSWAGSLDTELNVQLAADTVAVSEYNNQFGTDYRILPAAAYNPGALEIKIPAGQKQASLDISVDPSMFLADEKYMLAISIVSASEQKLASNFKTIVFPLIITQ